MIKTLCVTGVDRPDHIASRCPDCTRQAKRDSMRRKRAGAVMRRYAALDLPAEGDLVAALNAAVTLLARSPSLIWSSRVRQTIRTLAEVAATAQRNRRAA